MLRPHEGLGVAATGALTGLAVGVYFLGAFGWRLVPIFLLGAVATLGYTDFLARHYVGEFFAGLGLGALPVIGTAMAARSVNVSSDGGFLTQLDYARRGEITAEMRYVAERELVDAEIVAHTMDLLHDCGGVARISLIHRHGDGAALPGRNESVVHLQGVALPVTALAPLGQRARLSFEITRTQVVEHQVAFSEMTLGEFLLDAALSREQPVHGLINVVFIYAIEVQKLR